MEEKRLVDRIRDSGGKGNIGTEADGAILEMITIDDRVIVVKERSLYQFMLADAIDPKRENPGLPPHIQQLMLDRGAHDPLVARTFLTAKTLFQDAYIAEFFEKKAALRYALELVKELIAMDNEIAGYLAAEEKVSKEYEEQRGAPGSYRIPSIPDVYTRCKTIFQKADHACQALMDIVRQFFPEFGTQYYTKFETYIEGLYGQDDPFRKFLAEVVPDLVAVKNIRNCLDHRKVEIKVTDFELQANGDVISPTVEMSDNGTNVGRVALSAFLPEVLAGLTTIAETMLPYLCSKHIRSLGFTPEVRMIPEEKRRNKWIRYSLWLPLGDGGFYQQ